MQLLTCNIKVKKDGPEIIIDSEERDIISAA